MKPCHLKFKLPVGAYLGGLRHLGNGEFIGVLVPDKGKSPLSKVPFVLEATTPAGAEFEGTFRLDVCDDPLANQSDIQRRASRGVLHMDGDQVSEVELAEKLGIDREEYLRLVHGGGDA